MPRPTDSELRLIRAIRSIHRERGVLPTMREIARRLKLRNDAVKDLVASACLKNLVLVDQKKARTLRLTETGLWLLKGPPATGTIDFGFRCGRCNSLTFDRAKACFGCSKARAA